MMISKQIWCCQCREAVDARLTDGAEIYPHRPDLNSLPFWKCDTCKNYVGCHHKTINRTNPLGNIPSPEIKNARQHIHKILEPLWKGKKYKRNQLYAMISEACGIENYHTAELESIDECRRVYSFLRELKKGFNILEITQGGKKK